MAEILTYDDDVGFKKTPRYKGSTQRNDILRIIPVAEVDGGVKSAFFKHTIYVGKRQDGQLFIIHKHPDPAENVAAKMGYEEQTSACCFVLHLAQSPPRVQNYSWVLQAMVWSFGNDKWQRMKEIGRTMPIEKQELVIQCTEETYQKLTITVLHPDQQITKKLTPAQVAMAQASLAEGLDLYRDFLKPHSRVEQEKIIAGRGPAQAAGAGFLPFTGVAPTGGFPIGPGASQPLSVAPKPAPAPLSVANAQLAAENDPFGVLGGGGAASSTEPPKRAEIQVGNTVSVDLGALPPGNEPPPADTDEVSKIVTDLLDKSGS